MNYQNTYQEAYVVILNEKNRIIGSGIAFDSQHIITCAHVINVALQFRIDSTVSHVGKKVKISFPLNIHLSNEGKKDEATIINWYPESSKFALKNDIAILKINNAAIIEALELCAVDVEFVGSSSLGADKFKMISFDTMSDDQSSIEVYGRVGSYLQEEGKTVILSESDLMPFIQAGSSGSPVFSNTLNGIIGLTQALKKFDSQPNSKSGFIIDSRNIARIIPDIKIKPKGFGYYGEDKKNLKFEYQRKYSKNMCDRKEMIQYINLCINEKKSKGIISFLYTNYLKQEDSDDLLIRYKSEFLDPEIHESIFSHTIRIPDVSDLTLFKGTIINDFIDTLSFEFSAISFSEKSTLFSLLEESKQLHEKPILCLIDCDLEKLTVKHIKCLHWLNNEFLNVEKINNSIFDCHFIFIGKYLSSSVEDKLKIVMNGFNIADLIELKDVSFYDINKWIDRYIAENMRSKLRQRFEKKDYSMREIFSFYDDINKINLI